MILGVLLVESVSSFEACQVCYNLCMPEGDKEYEWDSSHEWPERWVRWLLRNSRATKMTKSNFDQALDNYRNSVVKILPDYISGRLGDLEALADELSLLLYSRDVLARALASADAAAQARLSETEQLDQQLLDLKDALLPLAPFYTSLRERKPRPRSQWWYYLDEIVSSPPDVSATKTAAGYWLPLTPHPVAA